MTAASLANMTVGGDRGNQYGSSQGTNSSDAKSNKVAADQLNVGTTAVKTAKEIKRDAPDLAEKVSRGEMSDQRLNSALDKSNRANSPDKKTNKLLGQVWEVARTEFIELFIKLFTQVW